MDCDVLGECSVLCEDCVVYFLHSNWLNPLCSLLCRTVCREDLQLIKKAVKKESEGGKKSRLGIKAASEGRKSGPPENSLILSFVHG